MEEGKHLMQHQQQQQQQQHHQQQLLLQQIQRRNDAAARFPSNIDAHLRPQQALLHQRPPPQIPNHPTPNPNPNPNPNVNSAAASANANTPQHFKASLQLSYQDAWRVCRPDYSRPFTSLEDACHRLLPYHVVADYEAEEDDKILDSDTTGQVLSRSQQWDHNIAAKVAEFTTTFEKQVLAFNMIYRKRGLGEFRTEEKLMMEQFLLNEEKQALFELKAKMDSRQKVSRETHEANMRMAAMAHMEQARVESQAHTEMMARAPIRASTLGSRGGNISSLGPGMGGGQEHDDMINEDDKEPSEDFLNDDENENGDTSLHSEWHGEVIFFDINGVFSCIQKSTTMNRLDLSCSMNQCGFVHWYHPECYTLFPYGDEYEYHGDLRGSSFSSYGGVNNRDKSMKRRLCPLCEKEIMVQLKLVTFVFHRLFVLFFYQCWLLCC